MTIAGKPISTEGYTYFTIYRAHAVYYNSAAEKYRYAAGVADGKIGVFDVSFEKIREQLDEITGSDR